MKQNPLNSLKVAVVTDWLTSRGGAEKVIFDILKLFPQADIFTSVYEEKLFPELKKHKVKTSFIQNIPFSSKKHQLFISLMPLAFESFDLSNYDLVISSNVACSKGIITKPSTLHVCYCHTPPRFAWDDSHNYNKNFPIPNILKKIGNKQLHKFRLWDQVAANRVDVFLTNSKFVEKRILKYYKQSSTVIYPGINIPNPSDNITHSIPHKDYYLALGRLISYKRFDLIIEAFNQNHKNLIIIGDGNMKKKLQKINTNPNTHFLGYVDSKTKNKYLLQAKALIFPQIEDFGLTPLEAQSYGTPVIALDKGGARETVIKNQTGIFFNDQTVESLNQAIQQFEKTNFDKENIVKHSKKFSSENFCHKFQETILNLYEQHQKKFS